MRTKLMAVAAVALPILSATAGGKSVFREDTITLPTYRPSGYDKTPVFYTGRVYQGAQGRVYPYPMQDVLTDERADETYRYLTLQNDWLQVGVLPEHGGRLHNLTDRATGFEAFYRQHVIKPALIGMLGAWTSGGVEWNFPHHHRPTTAMPIDWRTTVDAAGTPTLWLGETELRDRLKWTIGLTLLPDRAVLQAENIFMNRGSHLCSMLYWANVAASCGEDYQVIFPPTCGLGFDHHKKNWTTFPMGPLSKQPGATNIVDLGWWKNFTVSSRSIFAMDPDNAWLAGYDHKRNAGTIHVSNRHITVGKKFFLWGNHPSGKLWDSVVLTDTDGPYLELMVGCWSDNQPDYSWISPYETRRVKQFWYPVKGIGGVKEATIEGAVNYERRGAEQALVGFHVTRPVRNATVRCATRSGRVVFERGGLALGPDAPWCEMVKVPADAADEQLTVTLAAAGKTLLSYSPAPAPKVDLPSDVVSPSAPATYASAEKAYLIGVRLEQFHNGVVDPLPYYRRAIEIDPEYSAANVALGRHYLRRGEYGKAEKFLTAAVARVTQNYTRARDAEPEYLLALCRKGQGRLKEAEDLFWRTTWRATHKREALVEIALLALARKDGGEALERLDEALEIGAGEARIWGLRAYALRQAGRKAEAENARARAIACDPLDAWSVIEGVFAAEGTTASAGVEAVRRAGERRGLKAQGLLESVCDYRAVGGWREIAALCEAALALAAQERPVDPRGAKTHEELVEACGRYSSPMFAYFLAEARTRLGDAAGAAKALERAGTMCGDYCFPSRLEELEVLQAAAAARPCAATAYYLGEVLWHLERQGEAIAAWRTAIAANPKHALALRCLGFALTHPGTFYDSTGTPTGVANAEGLAFYRRAVEADPTNARTLLECDRAAERMGVGLAERRALLQKHRAAVDRYDPCYQRLVRILLKQGDFAGAVPMLTTRHFHVWEGGGGLHELYVEALVGLGRTRRAAGDWAGAKACFEKALEYPQNLEAARPAGAGSDPLVWWELAELARMRGDEAGRRTALARVLKDTPKKKGEMNYYRAKALAALGRTGEIAAEVKAIEGVAADLEKPSPRVISAYAKFGGDLSPEERTAERRARAAALRKMLEEIAAAAKPDVTVSPKGEVPSIEAAVRRVRELRSQGKIPADRAAEVVVEEGRYPVAQTLRLTPEDSGIHFTGRGWAKSVIDGGVEIGPFAEGPNGVWVAPVPKGFAFEQLWVNDRRATRARTPNEGLYLYMRDTDFAAPSSAFFARPSDLAPLAALSADELARVQVVYWQSWDMGYAAVRSIDAKTGHVMTARQGGRGYFFWDKTCPRYVLENYRGALDAPGEWFLDEKAGKLLYMPRPGERIGATRAYAPVVETILHVAGDKEKGAFVRDVTFEGIGFEFSRLAIGPDGIRNAQSASNVKTAAVFAEKADGLVFRNCRIAHTGAHGVWLRGGTTRSGLIHTLVEDLGAGGVYFGDGVADLKRPERNSTFLTLHDSIVRHGGRILNGAVGVWLGHVADCAVTHNEIADFLYTGVSMGWTWGYAATMTRRNHVDFNHIHHIQQGRLSDGGAFYSLGNQAGSTVCNNWVHDVNGYRDNGSPAWGLYTDEGSANILLASNLVERCRSGAIHQHYGTENTYANNILATFDEFGVWRSRTEDHVTIRVMNNIFWWTNPKAGTFVCHSKGPVKDIPADGNIYWCTAGAPSATAFNGDSWENWRKGGKDAAGAVADPLFVDAARGDWRLKPGSPALKAGFKPFDWHQAGVLKGDAVWCAKAAERTWDDFKDAAKAPLYYRERVAADFERLGLGVLKNAMGSLAPVKASPGRPGGIEIVADAASGKRALKFREVANLERPFYPMVDFACRIVEGMARLRFSIKGDKRCLVSIEGRDYDAPRVPFLTGPVLTLSGESIRMGGKEIAKVPEGTWADVEVALVLSGEKKGEWSCTVKPRGGVMGTQRGKVRDAAFSHLTWIGFISYGPAESTWLLDDIRLWRE